MFRDYLNGGFVFVSCDISAPNSNERISISRKGYDIQPCWISRKSYSVKLFKKDGSELKIFIRQFPLTPVFGMTIHKSQGLTLQKIAINIKDGDLFENKQLHVALSRVVALEGLFIINISYEIVKTPYAAQIKREIEEHVIISNLNYEIYDICDKLSNITVQI